MKTLAATLIALSAAFTFAESDYPYYPEFADRFCEYEEVTPLMAKKAAMVTGPIGEPAYVICEPLNIKRLSGIPICYQITYYKGKKLKQARKYNDLIRRINKGEKVLAQEISDTLPEFRKNGFYDDCRPGYVMGQTFYTPACITGYKGIAKAFEGFNACYEKAARAAGTNELYFKRFIGVGWTMLQTFEFETENGEKVLIATDTQPFPSAHETSYAAIENRERKLYETFNDPANYDMEVIKRNLEKWPVIEAGVPDEMAQKEFPKVIRIE